MRQRRLELSNSAVFKTTIESIVKNSNRTKVSKHTKDNYLDALEQYDKFVNSEKGLTKQMAPEALVVEAKRNVERAKERIRLFFLWLQGQPLPKFEPRGKSMKQTSACVRAYAQIRGVYANNGVTFGKWKTPNLADMKKEAIENDTNVPFFKLDKKRKVFLNRTLVKQFLANLKLRDKGIFLAMLSSSQDSGDIFELNVSDIRKQKDRERFYWEEQRNKTEVRFKTFFSAEATALIRQYLEQRKAKDDEPLFITTSNSRMKPYHLSGLFRDVAKKMGVNLENGYQNPFRPKRLRRIFRTGMTHAHVDEGYINAFMGHRTSVSKEYLEKPLTILENEYSKGEPYLTVYGFGSADLETIQTELAEWKGKVAELNIKVDELADNFAKNVEVVARDIFDKWLSELYQEEQKERETTIEQNKDVTRKEHAEHLEKRERGYAKTKQTKEKSQKLSKIEQPTEEELAEEEELLFAGIPKEKRA